MRYLLNYSESYTGEYYGITTTTNAVDFVSFPAIVGNPNYDAFLVQVDLTDEEVHALPVDEWIEA